MTTSRTRDVMAATGETLAVLDRHLGNPGIPTMHQQRFAVQTAGAGQYLIAWQDGAPVGHVLLHFRHPPHHASHAHYPDCAYVEALDVAAAHRRQGFGADLMAAAEARAKAAGADLVGLSVGVENAPARGLYAKLGYRPSGIADYDVSWTYLHPDTAEPMEEGEVCSFWIKRLAGI